MRTLIRLLFVCCVAGVVSACLVSAPPMVRADPVATTAVVLKVVDGGGGPIYFATTSRRGH
ncbi:hypothetical protein [Mycolicibacterium moriokaense]|uniref:hypothetical protein n=1 Tax=Mycolicibacterium moriokaense TaxID=39691 RepID=UPI000D770A52|nr:hypothetical protein [Mycolicibacterium moriokaense]